MPRLLPRPGHPTCTPCDIPHLCQSPMHRGHRGYLPGMANLRSLCLPTPIPSHVRTRCGQSSCSSCPPMLPTPSSNFPHGGSGGQVRHCPSLRCPSQGGVEVEWRGEGCGGLKCSVVPGINSAELCPLCSCLRFHYFLPLPVHIPALPRPPPELLSPE